ncbi:MAG: hypothetical protein WA477_08555, partial [Candidatus Sulfotelmatobacter sp.]
HFMWPLRVGNGLFIVANAMSAVCVRRAKAALFQWVQIPPGQLAPAGSNRSNYGGNEMVEAFG